VDWSENLFGPSNMNAFIGCGALSAGISSRGEITVLKYPNPSYFDQMAYLTRMRTLPRMGALANMGMFLGVTTGTEGDKKVSWLRDDPWEHEQFYLHDGSNVLVTRFRNDSLGLEAETRDLVDPFDDVLVRHVKIRRSAAGAEPPESDLPVQLVLFENLDPCTDKIPHLPISDWLLDALNDYGLLYSSRRGALLHFRPSPPEPESESLEPLLSAPQVEIDRFIEEVHLHYPEGIYLAMGADRMPDQVQCGLQARPDPQDPWPQDAFADAGDGTLSGSAVAPGRASGALAFPVDISAGEDELTLYLAAAPSSMGALLLLEKARTRGFDDFLASSEAWWQGQLASARMPEVPDPRLERVVRRAVISLLSARDRRTGSLVASIAPQPPYALDWPRDGAFMNHALDRCGFTEMVTQRNLWLAPLFHLDSGLLDMCFYSDGVPGGPLLHEIDNLSLAVWSLWEHASFLEDPGEQLSYLDEVYPAIHAAAGFLVRCRDPETGLQCPTQEGDQPWFTQGLAGAATARMGLEAAVRAGRSVGEDPAGIAEWQARSEELRQAIIEQFWDEGKRLFVEGPLGCYLFWPYPLLPLDDARMRDQARATLGWALENLHKETPGGGYEPLSLWMMSEQAGALDEWARESIEEALTIFVHEVATKGTLHFGEAYVTADLDGDGTLEFEAHAAQPQIPIASMVYTTAMALYGSPSPAAGDPVSTGSGVGCGACSHPGGHGPAAGMGAAIPLLLMTVFYLCAHAWLSGPSMLTQRKGKRNHEKI